jgi:hypothetical protein
MSTTTQTTIRGAALGGWPRSWRAAAGLTSVAAGAVILLGAFLPWVEAFAGLVQVPGVRGSNGQILAAAGAAIACAGLYQLARPAERARWFTGLAGFAAVGFSGYLLIQLARSMRVLGGDSMVIARPGPGLWVVATGSLAAFSTLFFPPSSQATLRRDARRPAMAWVADRESAGLRRGLQVALGVLGQLERLGHVGSVRDGFELVPPGVDGGAAGPADREGELAARLARGHRAGRPVDRSPAVPPHVPAEPRPGLRPAGAVQPLCLERLRAELPDPGDIADQIPDQFGRSRDVDGHGAFHQMII